MRKTRNNIKLASFLLTASLIGLGASPASADALDGQVLVGGKPLANSTVTLWAAGSGAPQQLAQAHTDADGRFAFASADAPGAESSLYSSHAAAIRPLTKPAATILRWRF